MARKSGNAARGTQNKSSHRHRAATRRPVQIGFTRKNRMEPPPKFPYSQFMDAIDWTAAEHALRATGFARLGKLLTPDQAHGLTAIYASETRFRSRIDMQRYRFGRGEYQYFAYPLPDSRSVHNSSPRGSPSRPDSRYFSSGSWR